MSLAARNYANDHKDELPATFDQFQTEITGMKAGNKLSEEAVQRFEFFPHERVINKTATKMILFRERNPRQLPDGTWQRTYCFVDTSVQLRDSPTTDFSDYEREHTATATNAPKAQDQAPQP